MLFGWFVSHALSLFKAFSYIRTYAFILYAYCFKNMLRLGFYVCWGQIFHTTWLHFIGDPYHVNTIMDFGRIYFKAQKSPYLQKWCRSPWSKIHGDIISSRPIVRAHGITSHFWFMIQAHESHWGNFGSRGLEGQEVCSVKLQWFKVDKGKHVAWHVFSNSLNSDGSVCNR